MNPSVLDTGDADLHDLVDQILSQVDAHEADDDHRVWDTFTGSELHLIALPVEQGGAGGTLADALAVAMRCARAGRASPFVANHLGQWSLTSVGPGVADGLAVVAVGAELGESAWHLRGVGWARDARTLLLVDSQARRLLAVDGEDVRVLERVDLAGEPSDDIVIPASAAVPVADAPFPIADLLARRSLFRAAQIAGAIRGCYELTRRYTRERQQFGKRLDTFPAVQRHLVELAQAAAITDLAVWRAAHAVADSGDYTAGLLARIVADAQAVEAIRCAHQAHGAIGMTREYPLHRLTRRLHAWSLDGGGRTSLETVGRAVATRASLTQFIWGPASS